MAIMVMHESCKARMDLSHYHKQGQISSFGVIIIKIIVGLALRVMIDTHYIGNLREVCHLRRQLTSSAERGHA